MGKSKSERKFLTTDDNVYIIFQEDLDYAATDDEAITDEVEHVPGREDGATIPPTQL